MVRIPLVEEREVAEGEEIAEVVSDMLSDRAYETLLDAILSLRLPPGQKLHVAKLSARMKLSPTPIRHALQRLAGEGLVTASAHRGFSVTRLSREQIEELYDLRLMGELHAAQCILNRRPDGFVAHLAEIEDAYKRLVDEKADLRAVLLKDRDFHCFIVDQARSPMLSKWYLGLNVHVQALRVAIRHDQATYSMRPAGTIAGHRRIVQAFAEGSVESVGQAIRDHIAFGRENAFRDLGLAVEQKEAFSGE